jgi:ketosteroid isomerase-like protein
MRHAPAILLLAAVFASDASGIEMSEEQRAVWTLEEAYWRFVQSGDVEAYETLWHDDFVGWPCHSRDPSDKSGIGSWVRDIRDNRWKLRYQLEPLAFRSFDDVVVVHYAAEYVYDYGDGTSSGAGLWRKFIHVWKRAGDDWKIISGMCAARAPVVAPRS